MKVELGYKWIDISVSQSNFVLHQKEINLNLWGKIFYIILSFHVSFELTCVSNIIWKMEVFPSFLSCYLTWLMVPLHVLLYCPLITSFFTHRISLNCILYIFQDIWCSIWNHRPRQSVICYKMYYCKFSSVTCHVYCQRCNSNEQDRWN